MSARVLGIDIALRRVDAVCLEGAAVVGLKQAPVDPDPQCLESSADVVVAGLLATYQPVLVAVDAPCGLAGKLGGGWGRLCESLLVAAVRDRWAEVHPFGGPARFGIAPSPPLESGKVPGWMRVGLAVFATLQAQGYPLAVDAAALADGRRAAVEVYPDATFWWLALARPDAVRAVAGAPLARKRGSPIADVVAQRVALLPAELRAALLGMPACRPAPAGAWTWWTPLRRR